MRKKIVTRVENFEGNRGAVAVDIRNELITGCERRGDQRLRPSANRIGDRWGSDAKNWKAVRKAARELPLEMRCRGDDAERRRIRDLEAGVRPIALPYDVDVRTVARGEGDGSGGKEIDAGTGGLRKCQQRGRREQAYRTQNHPLLFARDAPIVMS